jgi:hypothetical protein
LIENNPSGIKNEGEKLDSKCNLKGNRKNPQIDETIKM